MVNETNLLNVIGNIINSSLKNLLNNQPDILSHTLQTTMTEWNFAHHLANEISEYIFWLSHDIDVIKRNYNNRRPDIIFHKRGTNILNFLVVEIKIDSNVNEDIVRLKQDWMKPPLNYRFGASVKVKSNQEWIITILDNHGNKKTITNDVKISIPQTSKNEKDFINIISLVAQILLAKKNNPQADTSHLEHQIDQLVYKLYNLTDEEIEIVEEKK